MSDGWGAAILNSKSGERALRPAQHGLVDRGSLLRYCAMRFMAQGFYAESEFHFREVLRFLPDHASTLNNLGTAIWRQGRVQEAEEHYRRALVHDPNDYVIFRTWET